MKTRTWSGWVCAAVLFQPSPSVAARSGSEEVTTTTGDESLRQDYRLLSATGLAAAYSGFAAWTWFAWYEDKPTQPSWRYGGDGAFAIDTYAGGADKLGHVWSSLVLSRLGAELLEAGGWDPAPASVIASGLCLGALSLVEVNDGFYTEFSPGDLASDVAGVGIALAMRHLPKVDDGLDFRVQWFPSPAFRRNPGANFAEDYSGQTYLLAFKPGAFAMTRDSRNLFGILQYINPVVGFESRNYMPEPADDDRVTRRQAVLLGLTVDVQAIVDSLLSHQDSTLARISRGVGHRAFEYVNLPYATLPVVSLVREKEVAVGKE